jgi:hypothetical protein
MAPPPRPGARVFVTAWIPGIEPVTASAREETLYDSVVGASRALGESLSSGALTRIEIDVVQNEEPVGITSQMVVARRELGLYGYLATGDGGKIGYILPLELVTERLTKGGTRDGGVPLNGTALVEAIAERAGVDPAMVAQMRTTRFTTIARVEPAQRGGDAVALVRGKPVRPKTMSPQDLVVAVGGGAAYLARNLDEHGRFAYRYDPANDEVERGYDLLRHAGAVYAMMEAYGELGVPEWRDKAKLALGNLKSQVRQTPDGATFDQGRQLEQQKVGANGLGLLAFTEYARLTKDMTELPLMQSLARLIVHQQYPDGHYRANADVQREDEGAKDRELRREVFYYPGEATLGLVRLYSIDPNPEWLAAAKKGADYLVNVRDADADLDHQIHDHWLSYALHDLYALTKDPAYAAHAIKIAEAIAHAEKTAATAPSPDYVGSFYDDGETTPTSTRLEAVASTLELTRKMGQDETKLRALAMELACFVRGEQIDPDAAFFAKNPARAVGGVEQSVTRMDVRIDYVQHAMSGWLRLARLLRDPAWGKMP